MKHKIVLPVIIFFISIIPVFAAPLNPTQTSIDVQINGKANVWSQNHDFSPTYDQSGHSNDFSAADNYLHSSITAGNTPDCPDKASAGSTAGVKFEQLAFNKYVLTLSSSAFGDFFTLPAVQDYSPFVSFRADSMLNFNCSFEVSGLPGQQLGENSTIMVSLEHFGTIESVNGGMCSNNINLNISPEFGDDSYDYSVMLNPPYLNGNDGFQKNEFKGTRDFKDQWSTTIPVGGRFNVFATMQSNAEFGFDGNGYNFGSSASNFEDGIKVYMTVIPEPSSMILLATGLIMSFKKLRK